MERRRWVRGVNPSRTLVLPEERRPFSIRFPRVIEDSGGVCDVRNDGFWECPSSGRLSREGSGVRLNGGLSLDCDKGVGGDTGDDTDVTRYNLTLGDDPTQDEIPFIGNMKR